MFSISQTPKPFVMRIEQNQALVCHGWWWDKRGFSLPILGPFLRLLKQRTDQQQNTQISLIQIFHGLSAPARIRRLCATIRPVYVSARFVEGETQVEKEWWLSRQRSDCKICGQILLGFSVSLAPFLFLLFCNFQYAINIFLKFILVGDLSTQMYVHRRCVPCLQRPEDGVRLSGRGIADGCELPGGCWGFNTGPLPEQWS